jgi:predicted CXXCH cytochrome family protein
VRAVLVTAAVVALAVPGWVAAGVEGTHHDMRLYNLLEEQSVCAYCHVPHRAASDESLLAREGTRQQELGRVGAFCYSCHDGTVVPTALVEAPDGTLGIDALVNSHGRVLGRLKEVSAGLEDEQSVRVSGLVEADPDTGQLPQVMECTACHDPHNSTNRPFLVAPLEELCRRCHAGGDGLGRGRWTGTADRGAANGPHPVGMPVAFSGEDRARPEQVAPEMVFGTVAPALQVPWLAKTELGDPNRHWQTGGHLGAPGSAVEGQVLCSTCHSAHSVGESLLVLPASDPEARADPLCGGCHGLDGQPQNPGGTPYYHPVQEESAPPFATTTVPSRPLPVDIPAAWPVADDGSLLCATCHRMHQGRSGKRCLRDAGDGRAYSCDSCHDVEDDVSGENAHHLTSREDLSALLAGRDLSWAGGAGEPGDLADGLTCIDCHTGLAKSAHNW